MNRAQWQRLFWRTAFLALFVLAPILDMFRLDLDQGHFILFAHPWTLGIDASAPLQSGINIIVRAFLPIALIVAIGFIFITVATVLLTVEFTLARHLFCRFGCAVGLFQSLMWMANRKALVVGFDRKRAAACADCDKSCEHACPMRLQPRQIKRKMFTCTQYQQCVQACEHVNRPKGQDSLLQMVSNRCALDVSERDFGRRPEVPASCFVRAAVKGK